MIDFKKLAKQSGQKAWLHVQLPKMPALLYPSGSEDGMPVETMVEFEVVDKQWLRIHGGPTGYESVDLIKLLSEPHELGAKWIACMGSDRYARMEIRIDNIRHCVSNYSISYKFEVL